MIRTPLALFLACSVLLAPHPAHAWGATGHERVAAAAIEALSADIPAFLKTATARNQIALLAREPDRWRTSGRTHDADRDPAHFINIGDDGAIAGLKLDALPPTRAEFEGMMRDKGLKPGASGYLPYAMIDGYQQMVKDFAYWRASKVGAKAAKTKADRDWFAADLKLREMLLLRDIGVWSHYIADGSQPQHVSEHHAGWDAYPDPMTYPPPGQGAEIRSVHSYIEGPFVKTNVQPAAIRRAMAPYRPCACAIEQRVAAYLDATWRRLRPLYALIASGDIKATSPKAVEFLTARIADGASEVRDEIEDAWKASATAVVGWPNINVADIESGKVVISRLSYGAD